MSRRRASDYFDFEGEEASVSDHLSQTGSDDDGSSPAPSSKTTSKRVAVPVKTDQAKRARGAASVMTKKKQAIPRELSMLRDQIAQFAASPKHSTGNDADDDDADNAGDDEDELKKYRQTVASSIRNTGFLGGLSIDGVSGGLQGAELVAPADLEGEDAPPMDPALVPHGFSDNVRDEEGNIDMSKLQKVSAAARENPRTAKLLKPATTQDVADEQVKTDHEGFLYESCMLPSVYRERNILKKLAAEQRAQDEARRRLQKKPQQTKKASRPDDTEDDASSSSTTSLSFSTAAGGKSATAKGSVVTVDLDDAEEKKPSKTEQQEQEDSISKDQSRSRCLLCSRGSNESAAVPIAAVDNMTRTMMAGLGHRDPVEMARDLSEMFEKCVRQPANKHRLPHQEEIPLLTAEDVYVHVMNHTTDPSFILMKRIREIDALIAHLTNHCLYKVPKTRTKPEDYTGPPGTYMDSERRYAKIRDSDVVVSPQAFKQYVDALRLQQQLFKSELSKMIFYNRDKSLKMDEAAPLINPRRPFYGVPPVKTMDSGSTTIKTEHWSKVKNSF
jgi:hypothetical protein